MAPNDRPMPTSTLCSAIERERLAIVMASATRSSRSTISTTSAASLEAVAPRAPIATPTSAAARAGASLIPSPTMIVTPPSARSASTAATLSEGSRSDSTRSTPSAMPTDSATSGWSPVTITMRLMPARRSVRITRGVSGRIGSSITMAPATSPSTATNTQLEPSSAVRRRTSRARAGIAMPRATYPALPSAIEPAVHLSLDAGAVLLVHVGGEDELEVALPRGADDRRRQHVRRDLVERGGQAQQLVRVDRIEDLDLGDLRHAGRQRAGLVEQQHRAAGERLQRAAALHDDAAAGRAADAGDDRDRRRQDQRARCGDDEHGERAHRIAGQEPRAAGDDDRDRDEHDRVAVGQPDEGRLLPLGLVDQSHDAGVRALGRRRDRPQVETLAGAHGAGAHLLAGRALHRPRLARERALVEDRVAEQQPVDRHHLPRLHEQAIGGPDVLDRPATELAVLVAAHVLRRAFEQRRELLVRAAVRVGLEGLPAGQHQRDDGAGEVLADRERPRHGEERDQIDAGLAVDQPADRLPRERQDPDGGRDGPREVRGVVLAGDRQRGAGEDADDRGGQPPSCEVGATRGPGHLRRPRHVRPSGAHR